MDTQLNQLKIDSILINKTITASHIICWQNTVYKII